MLELGGSSSVSYDSSVLAGVYNGIAGIMGAGGGWRPEASSAVEKSVVNLDLADKQSQVQDAEYVISVIQAFKSSVQSIKEKIEEMEDLAEKGAEGTYSDEEAAAAQEEFGELAEAINVLVQNTEHGGNKLLSAEGERISVSIGNGSTIDIDTEDLSVDASECDLTTQQGAEAVLDYIETISDEVTQYGLYLDTKISQLESSQWLIEKEMAETTGISDVIDDSDVARQVLAYIAGQQTGQVSKLFDAQSNVSGARAAQLLS